MEVFVVGLVLDLVLIYKLDLVVSTQGVSSPGSPTAFVSQVVVLQFYIF